MASFEYLQRLIADEALDADLQITGRFFGAFTQGHFEHLRKQGELLHEKTGVTVHLITRAEQRSIIGSDYYYGGILVDEYGGLHTAKYHRALRGLARRRGASLHSHAAVERIERRGAHFHVQTARGPIEAKQVLVATNGYTGPLLPFFSRRVLPVASLPDRHRSAACRADVRSQPGPPDDQRLQAQSVLHTTLAGRHPDDFRLAARHP
jgi:glycine/D-amino acid oxidase-like deaminating enzyme